MTFYNNPHAAQAILEDRHNRLDNRIATKRGTLTARINRKATVTPIPRAQRATGRAAA